ncbi:flagellar filament capping protein FliD [Thiomicrospira sp. XS5]|uniref:flagellar filament capping protein FliD n=1 Tax=Thiomicrospira sp. XS5 TaxID=1775636 RepID=UPI000838246C|nr:flagellar filament capping protein FliD [Thiomicrospira sp. XS5]
MANDIGVSILNSMGANTFDVANMSKTLAEADVASRRSIIENNETRYNSRLTGYDTLGLAFDGFMSQVTTLTDISNFQQKSVLSSDPSVIDATVTGSPNNGSYQVEVQSLATSHTLATQAEFASTNSVVGEGTLSFNVGGAVSNVTIDATNNTLSGIQQAVNDAGIGVNATVVNVGTGYKLMFSSAQSGAGNTIDVSITGDTDGNNADASGLSRLATANMDQTVAAQDATIVVNGLTVTNSGNQIDGVIEGVSLNLKSSDIGSVKTIEIQNDTEGLGQAVQDFVDLYNSLGGIFDNLGSDETSEDDETMGVLNGDSTLREVESRIRSALIDSIPGLSGTVQSLADIGIKSNLDGTLSLDTGRLNTAIASNPEAIGQLFAASATATDNQVSYLGSTDETLEGTFDLTVNTAASQAQIAGGSIGAGGDITIDGTNNVLKVGVDGATSLDLQLTAGTYTREDLAKEMARVINNDTNVSAAGGHVAVEYDAATQSYTMTSEKYGSASKLELVSGNFLTSGVSGLGVTAETVGQDVQGYLENADGTLYTFVGQGQDVTINSILDGSPRGLELKVEGAATGARGSVEFNRGYADRLGILFDELMDSETGIVGNRISNYQDRLEDVEAEKEKVDDRYEKLEMKYRIQFGALQSLISQMDQTRQSLAAMLVTNNNDN